MIETLAQLINQLIPSVLTRMYWNIELFEFPHELKGNVRITACRTVMPNSLPTR